MLCLVITLVITYKPRLPVHSTLSWLSVQHCMQVYVDPEHLNVVFENPAQGNLWDYMKINTQMMQSAVVGLMQSGLPEDEARRLFQQVRSVK